MEHREWSPDGYKFGFRGKRVAIVGYSHHSDDTDYDGLTHDVLAKVIAGKRIQFFRSIASYFRSDDPAAFWQKVLFFNFLPTIVGNGNNRIGSGTTEQVEAGLQRVLRLIETHEPDILFVFTTRGWKQFPATLQDRGMRPTASNGLHQYVTTSGHEVQVAALRHPQGAILNNMRERVDEVFAALE